jgi:hypothetical protein
MKRFFLVCMMVLNGCSMLVEESADFETEITSDTESSSETTQGSSEETDSGQVDTGSVQETDTGSETVTQTTENPTDTVSVQETDTGSETAPVVVCDPKEPCCNTDGTLKAQGTVCFSDQLDLRCEFVSACGGSIEAQFNEAVCNGSSSSCDYGTLAPSAWRRFIECGPQDRCRDFAGEIGCLQDPVCFGN